jgi:hypothetical protein
MAAVAERAHADILSDTPLASDPVSVTMPGERLQQREKQHGKDDIECGVKIGNRTAGVRLDRDQRRSDLIEKGKCQCAADDPIDQIPDRQTLGGGNKASPEPAMPGSAAA